MYASGLHKKQWIATSNGCSSWFQNPHGFSQNTFLVSMCVTFDLLEIEKTNQHSAMGMGQGALC